MELDITKYTDVELFDFIHIPRIPVGDNVYPTINRQWSSDNIRGQIEKYKTALLSRADDGAAVIRFFDDVYRRIMSAIEDYLASSKVKTRLEKLLDLYKEDTKHIVDAAELEKKKQMYQKLMEMIVDEPVMVASSVSNEPSIDDLERTAAMTHNEAHMEQLKNPRIVNGFVIPEQKDIGRKQLDYLRGALNPLDRQIVKKVVNMDTTFCHSGDKEGMNTSHFIYTFPEPMRNVVSMRLAAAEIPNTWYLFDEMTRSNEMTINVYVPEELLGVSGDPVEVDGNDIGENKIGLRNDKGTLQSFVIKIPSGSWDIQKLTLEINTFLENHATDELDNLSLLYFGINETDNKSMFRFRTSGVSLPATSTNTLYNQLLQQVYFELIFVLHDDVERDIRKNLGWSLGFRKPYYKVMRQDNPYRRWVDVENTEYDYMNEEVFRGLVVSEAVYGSNKDTYLMLSVNDFVGNRSQDVISCFENNLMSTDILARIAIRYGTFTVNIDDSSDFVHRNRDYFGPVSIEKIEIKVLNKFGELVNMNGSDFSIVLEFSMIYS
jgi:hypothetical protein